MGQALKKSLFLPEEKKEFFIKLNVDGLLRGDYQSRMNGYATADRMVGCQPTISVKWKI